LPATQPFDDAFAVQYPQQKAEIKAMAKRKGIKRKSDSPGKIRNGRAPNFGTGGYYLFHFGWEVNGKISWRIPMGKGPFSSTGNWGTLRALSRG